MSSLLEQPSRHQLSPRRLFRERPRGQPSAPGAGPIQSRQPRTPSATGPASFRSGRSLRWHGWAGGMRRRLAHTRQLHWPSSPARENRAGFQ